jgi:hypothetical protein
MAWEEIGGAARAHAASHSTAAMPAMAGDRRNGGDNALLLLGPMAQFLWRSNATRPHTQGATALFFD